MKNQSLLKRFRNFLVVSAIFVAGGCCGMSLAIIVTAPTPTPTSIAQQIPTQTATSTEITPTKTPTASATATATATSQPSLTATPSASPTTTSTPTITRRAPPPTNTPRIKTVVTQAPTDVGTEDQQAEFSMYEDEIRQALTVFASKRDIVSVKVQDDRPNGGERVIIITYRTIETDAEARAKELLDIYVIVGGSLQAYQQDIDSVTLLIHDSQDSAIATSTMSKKDLVAYHNGEITMQQLIDRVKIETVSK